MRLAWQYLRSIAFIAAMYLTMVVMGLGLFPVTLVRREAAHGIARSYCRIVRWYAAVIAGLRSEVRGPVPDGEVIIASKHQSFFDIILIVSETARPKFIMKKELIWTPIVGYYAKAIGCVPVDRGGRGAAIKSMVAGVKAGKPGQLIIFPQGTRVAAGAKRPYKVGTGVLYKETGQRVVPAATNVGVFWPRHGLLRKPGLAVVEFLPAIEPGQAIEPFMAEMERVVETRSNELMAEAGFHAGD